ncbi:MAG: hypothetical protein GTO18_20500, partial [Anaerolineales bacterium]|nr:hypothetical protein [Anaerolineales bacterium]
VLSSFLSISILIAIHRLGQITDYPFGVGWSEGNRLWDYSLYFRRDLYTISGEFYYPTYLTPGRHGLWGLPFLFFSNPSIELLRYWDALLWLIPYLVLGIVTFVLKRNSLTRTWGWIFALWTLLFLLQGPIYAPLVISALLIVVAYDREKPWRTIVITFIACFYAGISRWTWMLAPAIWAGLWALLDEEEDLEWTRRIRFTVILGVAGVAGALAAQLFMNLAFPRPDTVYSTTLSQPLLWYRLWSSPTNPTGIVPGLLYALGPLTLWLLWVIISRRLKWSALQILGVTAALLVFLGVGLAASVKIGGGSNLHNMDMLLVTFVVLLGIIMICEGVFRDMPGYAWALLALAAIIPIWNLMNFEVDQDLPTKEDAKFALATVRACVEQATEEGEVLFIDQRQLLTFGQIQDAPLVMDYELKHMMNQAMSGNREYFEAFERDLEEHRFILIVSDPLHIVYQGKEIPFGEENDLWVDAVTVPILEHYEPVLKLNDVDIWLLMPENEDGICVGM